MTITLSFKLTQVARSKGGDRYEAVIPNERPMVIYIPQLFSRASGKVAQTLDITLTDGEKD